MHLVICPLCGTRKARRGCPAIGRQICAVCCGTKRLTEINCPPDCTWLASAREHPPAVVVRQQQRDVGVLVHAMRDFSERQSQLFLLVGTFVAGYQPAELQSLIDADVADATEALAATYETASRGVIYDHRPTSPAAARLVAALKPLLADAGKNLGSSFDRDAGVVLRRFADTVKEMGRANAENRRIFVDMVGRMMRRSPADTAGAEPPNDPPSLIVP